MNSSKASKCFAEDEPHDGLGRWSQDEFGLMGF